MRKSLKKFGKKQKRQNDRSRDNNINNNSWEAGDLQQGINKKSSDAHDAYGTDGGYTSGEEIAGVNATIGTTNASAMNN